MSIIVPVFNKADDLEHALRSALAQSLDAIEVVVVDDGSTDTSLQVAESLAAQDRRVVVLTRENGGAAAARNLGLSHARGAFVAFLDPDDWYPDPDVLRDLVDAAQAHDLPIAGGSLERFIGTRVTRSYPPSHSGYGFDADGVVEYADYQFDYGFWRFIYRRSFLIDHGILFPPYRRFQDPPFFVRAMSIAGRFAALPRSTYVYRVAKSTNWPPELVTDVLRGMIDVLKIAAERGYHELASRTIRRFNAAHIQSAVRHALEHDPDGLLPLLETMTLIGTRAGSIWQTATPIVPALADAAADVSAPAVSVIIPVHNSAAWLHECILSVLGQTDVPLELICVDDGSTDDSARILRDYQALDPARVRVVMQANEGVSAARNAGLTAARGRYVCFLDSDDYWRADHLSELVARADGQALDVLQFDAAPFADPGVSATDWSRYATYYRRSREEGGVVTGVALMASQIESSEYRPSACLYLIRRAHLDALHLQFITGTIHEDHPFTFTVLVNAKRAARAALTFYARRVRADSIMTSRSAEASMRGYFGSYLRMMQETAQRSDDAETSRALGKLLVRMFDTVSARMQEVDADAVCRLQDLTSTPAELAAYSTLVRIRTLADQPGA